MAKDYQYFFKLLSEVRWQVIKAGIETENETKKGRHTLIEQSLTLIK